MALKLKFNSTILAIIVILIVVIYGVVVEQTHRDNIQIHPDY